jgi:hypothetical protein
VFEMRISAFFIDEGRVEDVKNDLKGIGINEEKITVNDYAMEELRDSLQDELEEVSFNKAELAIFMDVRSFTPAEDVIWNTAGLIISVETTPGQKDAVLEALSKHQPQKVMIKD